VLHGGIAAGAFDTAVGCAALTVVPRDKVAITMDRSVRCEGEVINAGRTTVTAEHRLFDASGRLCGHATSALALIRPQILDTPASPER
jgi:acyl-coenzyme A thioesterase PaaI-like protein